MYMNYVTDLLLRYGSIYILIFFFLSSYFLFPISQFFYWISYYFLKIITEVKFVSGELLVGDGHRFLIIDACIAPSTYMFISFVFLMLPIPFKKNIGLLLKALMMFTLMNLLRILLLMWVHVDFGLEVFQTFHFIFYEGISGILTAGIIIYFLKREHIKKTYPLVTDVLILFKEIKKGK